MYFFINIFYKLNKKSGSFVVGTTELFPFVSPRLFVETDLVFSTMQANNWKHLRVIRSDIFLTFRIVVWSPLQRGHSVVQFILKHYECMIAPTETSGVELFDDRDAKV